MNSSCTRRDFTRLALGAIPAMATLAGGVRLNAAVKPDSKVGGVQIGVNAPYSFGNAAMSGDEILQTCVDLGLSGVELRAQPVERFLGAPEDLVSAKASVLRGGAAEDHARRFRQWRESASMEKAGELRRRYEEAGVKIEILKVDGYFKLADSEMDYVFTLAKALGARAISTEISKNPAELKRGGEFADKHRLLVGYHGHASTGPKHWEEAFAMAEFNGANVDLGHFVAGNHGNPAEFIRKHPARVTHVHVKDRKKNEGPNTPLGEGDTPVVEVLRLIRDHRWPIQATIEFEYKVPAGSTRLQEIARVVKYCRDALAG
ncbi:MAG: sugar phosphate isomerase/epimerase family protein [Limisphaerales bacterium]